MIRKLLFTAAAFFIGKKLMDAQKRNNTASGSDANRASSSGSDESGHKPTDLMSDHHPGPTERAPEAFRPNPTALVASEDRDSMRPATIPLDRS
ncbi:MAG TPA: hypothetical protein VJM81_07630 [Rhizorhapis sp.]|nr:hypothetical protein [Rhizorhapis sp.]